MPQLHVNINDTTAAELRRVAAERGLSATEVVARAVGVWSYLERRTDEGCSLQLLDHARGEVTPFSLRG